MTRIESRGIFSRTARGLLMIGAILAASPRSTVAQQKAEAKPQEKKAEAKPQPTQTPADDPGKLKAQLTALQQEAAQLKLKVATLELEKRGASVNVDKGKDGKEIATVNILGQWSLALHSPSSTTHTCGGVTGFCFVVPNSPQRQMSTPARPIGMPRGSPTIGTLSKSPITTRIRPTITASRWLAILLPVFVS